MRIKPRRQYELHPSPVTCDEYPNVGRLHRTTCVTHSFDSTRQKWLVKAANGDLAFVHRTELVKDLGARPRPLTRIQAAVMRAAAKPGGAVWKDFAAAKRSVGANDTNMGIMVTLSPLMGEAFGCGTMHYIAVRTRAFAHARGLEIESPHYEQDRLCNAKVPFPRYGYIMRWQGPMVNGRRQFIYSLTALGRAVLREHGDE